MYELIQVSERDYYIQSPAKIGLIRLSDTDVCLIDSGNDKDAGRKVRQIPTKNETKETSSSRSPKVELHVSGTHNSGVRKAIEAIKLSVRKVAKWTWNHKGEIAAGAVALGKIGLDIADAVSKSNSGNSGNGEYQPTSDTFRSFSDSGENSSVSSDDVISGDQDESEKGTHASPREHMVKPHGQHYGKDKVWKEKAAYPRGGKNKEDE